MATIEERLAEYEQLFADRYTEKDEDYQKHINTPVKPPPVITDWAASNYDRRDYRRDNRGQGGQRDRGWDSRYGGDRDRRDRYDSRDNRGHGGGHQDYRDRGPRDNRNPTQYKSSGFYQMYY